MNWRVPLSVAVVVLTLAEQAGAYIDIQPTLGRIVNESRWVFVVRVDRVSREKGAILYTKVADVRGTWPGQRLRHQLTTGNPPRPPRYLLDWAQPGREAVVFAGPYGALVCTGESWYRTTAPSGNAPAEPDADWWRMTLDCPELALAYRGSARRLAGAVREMVAGRTAIIPTVAHGAQGRGSFSDVVFNSLQSGGPVAMQRLRAGLFMPSTIFGINERSPWFVGLGATGENDLPDLSKALAAADKWDRVDALDEIRRVGKAAEPLTKQVAPLLNDPEPVVRLHTVATVLSLGRPSPEARDTLLSGLRDPSADLRREAARCLARLGPAADFAVPALVDALVRHPSDDDRFTMIEAIGVVGPAAAPAINSLIALLDNATLRGPAAEALGRIGPDASAALPRLATLLDSPDAADQWAAARAMVLIGGDGARPVVPFLVKRLEAASRGRELYQLTWLLGLLGPVARDALPALADARSRDNELASMAMWAVAPEESMPWQLGYTFDRDCDLWLFADYIDRMGDRSRGAAAALAQKIVAGRAGRVPSWGYHLLTARAEVATPILQAAAKSDGPDSPTSARARAALLRMGPAAQKEPDK